MDEIGTFDRNNVIIELSQGREFANELKKRLNPTKRCCDFLLEKIISSYDNALALLNCMALLGNDQITHQGSPISQGSNPDSKDQAHNKNKKRKKMAKWSEQVRVCSETGSEGHLGVGDGYNWRKYGQKDILGANHPRAYYRCTHRNTQGCLATKHVQRANDDPSMLEVVYKGKHSCMQERLKQNKENDQICIEPYLKVETQELDTKEAHFPSFSFPSTENVVTQLENFDYSPPFLSPQTSDSYFSLSQRNDFGDLAEIVSNVTPIMNFPFGDLDLVSIDKVDLDSYFIDASDYF